MGFLTFSFCFCAFIPGFICFSGVNEILDTFVKEDIVMYYGFAANLQVLNAKRSEIVSFLPGTTVVRWSDAYITVLDEHFDMESTTAAGKKLSGLLPESTVVSVAVEDAKRLKLAVWQKGKQLTARIVSPSSGASRKGDPDIFCQALGLREEDAVRLKTVWERGKVMEQLEFTGALMGAPLHCHAGDQPRVEAVRNEALVDEWIYYLADRTKGKNQTKLQIIQELSGLMIDEQTDGNGWEGFFHLRPVEGGEDYDWAESFFCRTGSDGKLERLPQLDPRPEVVRSPHTACKYIPVAEGRILSLLQEGDPACSVVVEDSAGLLACPLELTLDGNRRSCLNAWAMKDGGVLVHLGELQEFESEENGSEGNESEEKKLEGGLVRYAVDGTPLWSRSLEQSCEPRFFSDGQLWLSNKAGFFSVGIEGEDGFCIDLIPETHVDRERGGAVEYSMLDKSLPGEVWLMERFFSNSVHWDCKIFAFKRDGTLFYEAPLPVGVEGFFCQVVVTRKQVLLYEYNRGAWLLSAADLHVLAGSADHWGYLDAAVDGVGRIWLYAKGVWEAYDENLSLISRHRIRGGMCHQYLDNKGRLCVITYDEEAGIMRVYRLA